MTNIKAPEDHYLLITYHLKGGTVCQIPTMEVECLPHKHVRRIRGAEEDNLPECVSDFMASTVDMDSIAMSTLHKVKYQNIAQEVPSPAGSQ